MKYYRTEKQRLYYEKVISLYRDQHMGKTRIAKIIPVSDWTISNWIRTFVAENPKYKNKRMKMAEEKRKQKAIEESLQSPLPMINVAEKQFNISIRKKAGTKQ